jgi:hypothetical protein
MIEFFLIFSESFSHSILTSILLFIGFLFINIYLMRDSFVFSPFFELSSIIIFLAFSSFLDNFSNNLFSSI